MKKSIFLLFGSFLITFYQFSSLDLLRPILKKNQTTQEWEIVNEIDDIKVYAKDVEGSNLKELKIEMWFRDASLSDIITVVSNGANYSNWLYKCTYAENIERISPQEKTDYFQLDFPWPLSNRDVYNHSIVSQDPISRKLSIHSDPVATYPIKEDFVRVTENPTRWYFYPKENGDVFLEYYTAPNPGGNIPDWMVNLVIDKGPTKSMQQLQVLVQEQRGKAKPLDWIK